MFLKATIKTILVIRVCPVAAGGRREDSLAVFQGSLPRNDRPRPGVVLVLGPIAAVVLVEEFVWREALVGEIGMAHVRRRGTRGDV
jgi:membrane protease YdiL (CAAX protease family)